MLKIEVAYNRNAINGNLIIIFVFSLTLLDIAFLLKNIYIFFKKIYSLKERMLLT